MVTETGMDVIELFLQANYITIINQDLVSTDQNTITNATPDQDAITNATSDQDAITHVITDQYMMTYVTLNQAVVAIFSDLHIPVSTELKKNEKRSKLVKIHLLILYLVSTSKKYC